MQIWGFVLVSYVLNFSTSCGSGCVQFNFCGFFQLLIVFGILFFFVFVFCFLCYLAGFPKFICHCCFLLANFSYSGCFLSFCYILVFFSNSFLGCFDLFSLFVFIVFALFSFLLVDFCC